MKTTFSLHEYMNLESKLGSVNKTLIDLKRGELLLIKEMLSDGDPFHTRILKHVSSLEDKINKTLNGV